MNLFIRVLLVAFALSSQSFADEKTLTAFQIKKLLSGNTAIGRWIDHDYRQYFDKDGSTIYAQEKQRSSLGRWRVNRLTNHYESWWEQVGWGSGYSVVLKDGVYYWVSSVGSAEPHAFEVVQGSQLLFTEKKP